MIPCNSFSYPLKHLMNKLGYILARRSRTVKFSPSTAGSVFRRFTDEDSALCISHIGLYFTQDNRRQYEPARGEKFSLTRTNAWDRIFIGTTRYYSFVKCVTILNNISLLLMQESYFDPQFLRIVKYAKSEKSSFKGLLSVPCVKAHNGKKFSFSFYRVSPKKYNHGKLTHCS